MNVHVQEVIAASERILLSLEGVSYEDFLQDGPHADAVLRDVEAIGNAARAILSEGPGRYAAVDWEGVVAAAGFLARGRKAFGIDYEILWYFAKTQLPPMKHKITDIGDASR